MLDHIPLTVFGSGTRKSFHSVTPTVRRRWWSNRLDSSDDPTLVPNKVQPRQVFDDHDDYNLVSSLATDGFHYPVFDVDVPCRYVKSSTKGHGHLYFDNTQLNWSQYVALLGALVNAKIIDPAYLQHSLNHGMSTVRPQHHRKKRADRPAKDRKAPRPVNTSPNDDWLF